MSKESEELKRFLAESGQGLTDAQFSSVLQFHRNAEQASGYFWRAASSFPLKQDVLSLKNRSESGDPCVIKYLNKDGHIERYALAFTKNQSDALEARYQSAFERTGGVLHQYQNEAEAGVFVGTIEGLASIISDNDLNEPPTQKERQRSIDGVINALEKLDVALKDMDSAGLGWLYASIVDNLAKNGITVSPDDFQVVSMRNHRMKAIAEAGEFRALVNQIVASVVGAAKEARASLPKAHRPDKRLKVAIGLRYHMERHKLSFEPVADSYAAQCLDAIYVLANLPGENLNYWLREAAAVSDPFTELFK